MITFREEQCEIFESLRSKFSHEELRELMDYDEKIAMAAKIWMEERATKTS